MSARTGRGADEVAFIAAVLVAGVVGITVLDQAPWVLPWALAGVLLAEVTALVAIRGRRVIGRRTVWRPAAAGIVLAVLVWGGSGTALNQKARIQLRARPAAALAAYVRGHSSPTRVRTRRERQRARRRQRTLARSPAARLYGVGQLGHWHWQRLIASDSALLGGPLALWGIAVGLALARRRRRRPGSPSPPASSLSSVGQSSLRTAGRGQ